MILGTLLLAAAGTYAAIEANTLQDEANIMTQARTADLWFEKWGFKMTRGTVNSGSCWMEVPRCISVETQENSVVGPVKGFFKGIGMTFVRAVAGIMDIATFGTVDDTYTVYDRYSFPYFVWQDWSRQDQ
jgi:putative exosortase-associated protein (TIGR04073 family)